MIVVVPVALLGIGMVILGLYGTAVLMWATYMTLRDIIRSRK